MKGRKLGAKKMLCAGKWKNQDLTGYKELNEQERRNLKGGECNGIRELGAFQNERT
jgi:hypothetical protein